MKRIYIIGFIILYTIIGVGCSVEDNFHHKEEVEYQGVVTSQNYIPAEFEWVCAGGRGNQRVQRRVSFESYSTTVEVVICEEKIKFSTSNRSIYNNYNRGDTIAIKHITNYNENNEIIRSYLSF